MIMTRYLTKMTMTDNVETNNSDVLIFLDYWDNANPTSEAQMGFMFLQMDNEMDAADLGSVYTNESFYQKDPREVILTAIDKHHPRWVIGLENSATLLLEYRRQKKMLINPHVTEADLQEVSPEAIENTYAFFSSACEVDYERYCKVYQNVAYYPASRILTIGELLPVIETIVAGQTGV